MTEREAHILFNMVPGVGSAALAKLSAAAGGSAADAWALYPDKRDWEGNPPDLEGELARAEKLHVKIVTALDEGYPELLRRIPSPPLALYVSGEVSALSAPGVALVGTRHASLYGKETAERFAAGLASAGKSVISGLASGIDAAAHKGALDGGGVTVGVLGGALDRFWPEENRKLAHAMLDAGGAVASEFPFGRNPDRQTFPQRNRIVSGLSLGVVAVECPLKSGTMITCTRAAEQGRPVMAVPGRIDSKLSAGCLSLIRDGARMVTCTDDILEEISPLGKTPHTAGASKARAAKAPLPEEKISLEEALVIRSIPDGGASVDSVARAAKLPAAKVNSLLVALRVKRRIRFLPGNRVTLYG